MIAQTDGQFYNYITNENKQANIWRARPGLSGLKDTYSFESIVSPGYYLMANGDGQVMVSEKKPYAEYKDAVSWKIVPGPMGANGFALESVY